MARGKVHRVKDNSIVKHYRFIPYGELVEVLEKDGEAFLEGPVKRQTVWKAARRLSELVGRKVVASRALYQIDEKLSLEGYSFYIKE